MKGAIYIKNEEIILENTKAEILDALNAALEREKNMAKIKYEPKKEYETNAKKLKIERDSEIEEYNYKLKREREINNNKWEDEKKKEKTFYLKKK